MIRRPPSSTRTDTLVPDTTLVLSVDEVVIGCRGEIIARHSRCWEREDVIFDPVHYLPLFEQKINSLDQAAPFQGWHLPEAFASLRRLLEGRMAQHGRREYVQVLRLLESFDLADLHAAVKQIGSAP